MPLRLEKRSAPSRIMMAASPFIALALTLVFGAIVFASLGKDPIEGLYVFFIEPLLDTWSLEEILVKATPLALIAVGLCVCYLANVWNIGAEGQLVAGAIAGGAIPVLFPEWQSSATLPLMLAMGVLGGALYGLIPAILKVRFGASEILTSLMLVYVAELLLDWLVRGPWRNPAGFNFPESAPFGASATMPLLGDDRLNIGLLIAIAVAIVLSFALVRTIQGFSVLVAGEAPRAARFAGVNRDRLTLGVLALSGGLAGLAGIMEAAGPIGQLQPEISPGYGFTAIIVAFLGRLNPIGALLAAFLLSLTFIGGENAQIAMGVSDKITRVFQGVLLFLVLACDTLIHNRIALRRVAPSKGAAT